MQCFVTYEFKSENRVLQLFLTSALGFSNKVKNAHVFKDLEAAKEAVNSVEALDSLTSLVILSVDHDLTVTARSKTNGLIAVIDVQRIRLEIEVTTRSKMYSAKIGFMYSVTDAVDELNIRNLPDLYRVLEDNIAPLIREDTDIVLISEILDECYVMCLRVIGGSPEIVHACFFYRIKDGKFILPV